MAVYKIKLNFSNVGYLNIDAETPKEAYEKARVLLNEEFSKFNKDAGEPKSLLVDPYVGWMYEPLGEETVVWSEDMEKAWDCTGRPWPDCEYETNEDESFDDDNCNETEDYKWIWGLKSYDDLSSLDACLFTMNDIDIIFDKTEKVYVLGLEEIYHFTPKEAVLTYFENLLKKFGEWLKQEHGFTDEDLDNVKECSCWRYYYPTLCVGDVLPLKAHTLLDLYYKFMLFVVSYRAMWTIAFSE